MGFLFFNTLVFSNYINFIGYMEKTINTVNTRVANITKDEKGIIIITMIDAVDVDHEDVLDVNLVMRHLSNDEPALKLFDSRANWKISATAEKEAMKQDSVSKTKARAIVVSNSLKANVLSFIKQFEKRGYPQQYFSNYEEAYQWLLSFKQ